MKKKSATEKQLSKFERNYADDQELCDRFMTEFSDIMQTCRNNRVELERVWLEDLRMWSCRLDTQGYVGRSNLFVPELNEQIEVNVEKAVSSLFPPGQYVKAIPLPGTSLEKAQHISDAVYNELEYKNGVSSRWDEFERQKTIFGTAIVKTTFEKDTKKIFTRDSTGKPIEVEVPLFYGVKVNYVDLFRWYLFPEICELHTAQLVFEDTIMNLEKAKDMDIYYGVEDVPELARDMDHDWADQERFEFARLSQTLKYYSGSALFTEVWVEFAMDGKKKVPVKAVIANKAKIVQLIYNPYWYQTHPYDAARYLKRPGIVFYGFSLMDKLRSQGYAMNDVMNHTMDSLSYSMNPISIIDPALAGDVNSFKMQPGAKWWGSPEGIRMDQFPDVSPSGLRALQEIRGQIAQFSGNTPGLAPQLTGKARSATQANIVQTNVNERQRIMSRREEIDVMAPICKKTHILLLQYMDKAFQIKVQGPDVGSWIFEMVDPADIVGEVDFVWRGSSEEEMTAVRTQQLLAFFQQALQMSSIMPGEIDLPALFLRVAKEGFNIRDLDEVFNSVKKEKTVDPYLENQALINGDDIKVRYGDNDDEHIEVHTEGLSTKGLDKVEKLQILRHIEKHKVQKQGKEALQDAQARISAMKMLAPEGPAGQEQLDQRGGPQVPSPMEGNQGQAPSQAEDVFSGVQGS